jgi:hypothetical protein
MVDGEVSGRARRDPIMVGKAVAMEEPEKEA